MRIELVNIYYHHLINGKKYLKRETACYATPIKNGQYLLIREGEYAGEIIPTHLTVKDDLELCGLVLPTNFYFKNSPEQDIWLFLLDYLDNAVDIDDFIFEYSIDEKTGVVEYVHDVNEEIISKINERQYKFLNPNKGLKIKSAEKIVFDKIDYYYDEITKRVIGQDEAIKSLLSSIYSWQKLVDAQITPDERRLMKPTMFVIGPTGSGKTEILRQITRLLKVPIIIEDANRYTMEGFVGQSVDDMLINLIEKCNGNVDLAERGIIVIDEADKLEGNSTDEKVVSTGVQHALITMMEGGVYTVKRFGSPKSDTYEIDTKNIQFVLMGSFDNQMIIEKNIGFGSSIKPKHKNYKELEPTDLINLGMAPELIGRCSKIIGLNNLSKDDYKKIITESKISYLNVQKEILKLKGIELTATKEFIDELAKRVVESRIGARGIKTILSRTLSDIEYDINLGTYSHIILDENYFKDMKIKTLKKV